MRMATPLVLTGVSNQSHGTTTFDAASGVVTFTPDADYHGPAGFDYQVSDGTATVTGHVAVTVMSGQRCAGRAGATRP